MSVVCQDDPVRSATKALQTRHPSMIWSADTVDGGRILFLIEFLRTAERLLAPRATTHAGLG